MPQRVAAAVDGDDLEGFRLGVGGEAAPRAESPGDAGGDIVVVAEEVFWGRAAVGIGVVKLGWVEAGVMGIAEAELFAGRGAAEVIASLVSGGAGLDLDGTVIAEVDGDEVVLKVEALFDVGLGCDGFFQPVFTEHTAFEAHGVIGPAEGEVSLLNRAAEDGGTKALAGEGACVVSEGGRGACEDETGKGEKGEVGRTYGV